MVKEPTDYSKILEDIRHIYKQKYNVALDDELLYIIIRVNELQVSLNRKIDDIPKVTFKTGKDYFLYSLGKYLAFLILGIGLLTIGGFLLVLKDDNKGYVIEIKDNGTEIKLKGYKGASDTALFIPSEKKIDHTIKPKNLR